MHGNRAKNLGAGCINIKLSKQNPTKQQKIIYQERYLEAIRDALRWEEWTQKMVNRREEEQKIKSDQYAKMQIQAAMAGTGIETKEKSTNSEWGKE